jgi:hypothetical protein
MGLRGSWDLIAVVLALWSVHLYVLIGFIFFLGRNAARRYPTSGTEPKKEPERSEPEIIWSGPRSLPYECPRITLRSHPRTWYDTGGVRR